MEKQWMFICCCQKNKPDGSTLTELMSLSDNEIEPIITDLLEWLQDSNWPIATRIKSVVGKHYKLSEPYVLSVLQGTDEIWKYWILRELMYEWQPCPGSDLLNEISRIAQHPTPDRSYRGEVDKAVPNLLERDFSTKAPNEKWVTDVTEFPLSGQKLYLSPILDLHSRDLVSYTIYEHPTLSMVTDMVKLEPPVLSRGVEPILHSNQGWHYQHKHYQKLLKDNGIRKSMSGKGNCLDNAVMENSFGL